jgi:amino acid transporter
MSLLRRLLGRRLATWEAERVKIGATRGVPVLGLDALASAAYGPEAALVILIPLGVAWLDSIRPITTAILALLVIVYFSYRQTIVAYPNGGGAYIVAKENLGTHAGLCAAAALIIDYVLNVAVGISAGVGALVSAFPALHEHTLALCLVILILIAVVNLRGVRESGAAFGVPTYAFVVLMATILIVGITKALAANGQPVPVVPPPHLTAAAGAAGLWIFLRAFASGCTAMTGVEAVSNGVPMFKEPAPKYANRTLTIIVAILGFFLAAIAYLAHAYRIGAMSQEVTGYQTVLSSLVAAVVGRGFLYYATVGSLLAVLCLSANTSFAGFPRMSRVMAEDDFLPHVFAHVGRRLVYSVGIIVLTVLAGALLIAFGGITEHLIPLFAVGAFGAFTFSQAGMVVHWRRLGTRKHWMRLTVNAVGAVTTAAALVVIVAAKFTAGAWIPVVLTPVILLLFHSVRAHYAKVDRQLTRDAELEVDEPVRFTVVVPVKSWDNLTEKALRFARGISDDVTGVHIYSDDEECRILQESWARNVEQPLARAGLPPTPLACISSPYRRLLTPLLDYIDQLLEEKPGTVALILPDLVNARWWEYLLHTSRANLLRSMLLLKGNPRIAVIAVPWNLERRGKHVRTDHVKFDRVLQPELLPDDRRHEP